MSKQAERVVLSAAKRNVIGKKVKILRQEGWVPAVMYGRGFDAVSLQVEEKAMSQFLSQVTGSQLVKIDVADAEEQEMALVRDVQRDPIRGNLLHVDFYRVNMEERLRTEIPILLEGDSPVAARGEGILLQGIDAIEVECLPNALVDAIAVDLTELEEVDDSIHVGDLAVPAGIDIITELDEMIARVAPLAEEEAIEELLAAPVAEEEVLVGEELELGMAEEELELEEGVEPEEGEAVEEEGAEEEA